MGAGEKNVCGGMGCGCGCGFMCGCECRWVCVCVRGCMHVGVLVVDTRSVVDVCGRVRVSLFMYVLAWQGDTG